MQEQPVASGDLEARSARSLYDLQAVGPPEDVVRLARDIPPFALARLRLEPALLALDPGQTGNDCDPDGVFAHGYRGRDAHVAGRRINPDVQVLDRFADDLHRNPGDFELGGGFSIHLRQHDVDDPVDLGLIRRISSNLSGSVPAFVAGPTRLRCLTNDRVHPQPPGPRRRKIVKERLPAGVETWSG